MLNRIDNLVESKGYELLEVGHFPHEDDKFLKCIIAKNEKEYVCWVYNSSDNALYEGYYTSTYELAYEKFKKRLS